MEVLFDAPVRALVRSGVRAGFEKARDV